MTTSRVARIDEKPFRLDSRPRVVSIYELREMLLPYMLGVPWAEDALMDLWKMGAPDPSPGSRPCQGVCEMQKKTGVSCGKWGCRKVKRVLLPGQFAQWWQQVAQRQGLEIRADG